MMFLVILYHHREKIMRIVKPMILIGGRISFAFVTPLILAIHIVVVNYFSKCLTNAPYQRMKYYDTSPFRAMCEIMINQG